MQRRAAKQHSLGFKHPQHRQQQQWQRQRLLSCIAHHHTLQWTQSPQKTLLAEVPNSQLLLQLRQLQVEVPAAMLTDLSLPGAGKVVARVVRMALMLALHVVVAALQAELLLLLLLLLLPCLQPQVPLLLLLLPACPCWLQQPCYPQGVPAPCCLVWHRPLQQQLLARVLSY
jgi:hypothetical protein